MVKTKYNIMAFVSLPSNLNFTIYYHEIAQLCKHFSRKTPISPFQSRKARAVFAKMAVTAMINAVLYIISHPKHPKTVFIGVNPRQKTESPGLPCNSRPNVVLS